MQPVQHKNTTNRSHVAAMIALASHQCGLNPGVDAICGLSLLFASSSLEGYLPVSPVLKKRF